MGITVQECKLRTALDPGRPHLDIHFQCGLRAATWKPISKTAETGGLILLSASSCLIARLKMK